MLLIAIPKSASTSLMWSISEILHIPHKNGQNKRKGDKKCPGYTELQKYHGTTVKRSYSFLEKYIENKKIIYKEHILPTHDHIKKIEKINKPVIVLLRDPAAIIKSYKRVFSVLPELKINIKELEKELEIFYIIYRKKKDIFLVVDYMDVVFNFTETIKKIIKHYGFEVPKDIEKYELAKRNYTGHGMRDILGNN